MQKRSIQSTAFGALHTLYTYNPTRTAIARSRSTLSEVEGWSLSLVEGNDDEAIRSTNSSSPAEPRIPDHESRTSARV